MPETVRPVQPVLEPAAAAFAEATANPPYLFDLAPAEGRKAVDEVQSGESPKPRDRRGVDHRPGRSDGRRPCPHRQARGRHRRRCR